MNISMSFIIKANKNFFTFYPPPFLLKGHFSRLQACWENLKISRLLTVKPTLRLRAWVVCQQVSNILIFNIQQTNIWLRCQEGSQPVWKPVSCSSRIRARAAGYCYLQLHHQSHDGECKQGQFGVNSRTKSRRDSLTPRNVYASLWLKRTF